MSIGVAERKVAAVLGAACADAAAQPLHWLYNAEKLSRIIGDKEEIEFNPESENPFYRIKTGQNTCYGDQAFVLLESLAVHKGLNVKDLTERTYKWFGPGSGYDKTLFKEYDPSIRHQWDGKFQPLNGKWRHKSIKDFLENVEQNKPDTGSEEDQQIDCVARMAPLVALYAGQPDMLDKVAAGIAVIQASDTVEAIVCAAARLLEQFILYGRAALDAVQNVLQQLEDPDRTHPTDLDRGVAAQIREVLAVKDEPHVHVVRNVFVNH